MMHLLTVILERDEHPVTAGEFLVCVEKRMGAEVETMLVLDGRGRFERVQEWKPIPADAKYVDSWVDHGRRCECLTLEHPMFPPTPPATRAMEAPGRVMGGAKP